MGIFDNLASIITAPVKVADEVFVKPWAELAEDIVDEFKGK